MDQMKGNLLLLLTALIWGSAFVAQSVGMDYVGPFTFNAARNLLATGVLVPVVLAFGGVRQGSLWQRLRPDAVTVKAGLCCGVIMGVASNLQQVGIAQTTAGKAGFITALYIIMVPILGRFLGRTVRKILLLCVPMALVGFYLLCVTGDFTISFGDFLVFLCAVFFALHILCVDHFLLQGASGVRVAWIQFAMTFLVSLLGALVWGNPARRRSGLCPVGGPVAPAVYGGAFQRGGLYPPDRGAEVHRPHHRHPDHEPGIGVCGAGRVAVPGRSDDPAGNHRLRAGVCRRAAGAAVGNGLLKFLSNLGIIKGISYTLNLNVGRCAKSHE